MHTDSKERSPLIFLGLHPITFLAENPLVSTLRIHSFSRVLNREQHQKHLYNLSSYHGKYAMFNRLNTCPSCQSKCGYVAQSWTHIESLHYALFPATHFKHFE